MYQSERKKKNSSILLCQWCIYPYVKCKEHDHKKGKHSLSYLKTGIFDCLKTLPSASDIWQAIAKLNFILNPFMGCVVWIIVTSNAPLIYSEALARLQHTVYLLIAVNLCNKNTNLVFH